MYRVGRIKIKVASESHLLGDSTARGDPVRVTITLARNVGYVTFLTCISCLSVVGHHVVMSVSLSNFDEGSILDPHHLFFFPAVRRRRRICFTKI